MSEMSDIMARYAEVFDDMSDLACLIDRFADRKVICLGESTHGTHEFYAARAAITERLVREHNYTIVAVEADWPDAAVYDAAIRSDHQRRHAERPFTRFPRWMWRNQETWDLLHALRDANRQRPSARRAGFYGLDVYSLCASIDAVVDYLEEVDPTAADEARSLYGCLKPYCGDPGAYLRNEVARGHSDCEDGAVQVLTDLLRERMDGMALFDAEQNARIVVDGERYYRSMYYSDVSSWNLRDEHMFDTLQRLLAREGPDAKAVVWAHNSHIGNAAATEMGQRRGELNIGQLVREAYGDRAALIGFSTNTGEVAAADDWDDPMQIKRVRPGLADSHEAHAHATGQPRFLLDLHRAEGAALSRPHLQRAIGVVYRPSTERWSHYFEAELDRQFDAWIWFDETRAVDAGHAAPKGGAADLFPTGL